MFLSQYYLIFKSIHIIAIISWMAGLLYLPRLYVYHTKVGFGSEADRLFQIMEYRLLKFIMNPAMILSYVTGFINASIYGFSALDKWFYIKISAVIILTVFHMFLAKCRKIFTTGKNTYSEKFFKIINEIPTICMIIAVTMVVIKPFD